MEGVSIIEDSLLKLATIAHVPASPDVVPVHFSVKLTASSSVSRKTFCMQRTTHQPMAAAEADPESVLMSVRRFALGGTGCVGKISAAEQACVALIRSRDTETINRILSSASLAGQLYALWALRHLDPERFATERERYAKEGGRVDLQSGCCVMGGSDVSKALDRLDDYMSRSLRVRDRDH